MLLGFLSVLSVVSPPPSVAGAVSLGSIGGATELLIPVSSGY